jgi:hypothetical protein
VAWPGRELRDQPACLPPPEVKMDELGKKVKMLEKNSKKMLGKNVETISTTIPTIFNIS